MKAENAKGLEIEDKLGRCALQPEERVVDSRQRVVAAVHFDDGKLLGVIRQVVAPSKSLRIKNAGPFLVRPAAGAETDRVHGTLNAKLWGLNCSSLSFVFRHSPCH